MAATETEIAIAAAPGEADLRPPAPPAFLGLRLGLLIFLAFTVMGAWLPVFSLHLKNLYFSPEATAWASATNAIGAMLAPLFWGQIADRWLATERCICLCAFVSGVGLWLLAGVTSPLLMVLGCIVLWFFLIPVMGLTGAFIFRQLEHPDRDYGRIRVWGTLGWMAANWGLTLWFALQTWRSVDLEPQPADLADSMRLAALMAFLVAAYALTMPHTPPTPPAYAGRRRRFRLLHLMDAPLQALQLFRQRSFVVYCACMFGFYVTMSFPIQLNPLRLKEIGVEANMVPVYLTMCQALEVATLLLLPWLLTRFGVKATMVLGALAWTLGMAGLSVGEPMGLVLASLSTSGVFICCFVISGQVFVNRQASPDIRASAQGLLIFINGSGLLLGHLLVGLLRDWTSDQYSVAYLVAAIVSAALFVLFAAGFTLAPSVETDREALVPSAEMP